MLVKPFLCVYQRNFGNANSENIRDTFLHIAGTNQTTNTKNSRYTFPLCIFFQNNYQRISCYPCSHSFIHHQKTTSFNKLSCVLYCSLAFSNFLTENANKTFVVAPIYHSIICHFQLIVYPMFFAWSKQPRNSLIHVPRQNDETFSCLISSTPKHVNTRLSIRSIIRRDGKNGWRKIEGLHGIRFADFY